LRHSRVIGIAAESPTQNTDRHLIAEATYFFCVNI
jgi:hypothetical protein